MRTPNKQTCLCINIICIGSGATIKIKLYGSMGATGWMELDNDDKNDFERNHKDTFSVRPGHKVGKIHRVDYRIWGDDGWMPEKVMFPSSFSFFIRPCYIFPIGKLILI